MSSVFREFQVFVKPVGARCNLACSYCYYLEKQDIVSSSLGGVMSDEILERYIRQHIEASTEPEIFFSWHGGEPTMAGLDFYMKAVEYQKRFQTRRQHSSKRHTDQRDADHRRVGQVPQP